MLDWLLPKEANELFGPVGVAGGGIELLLTISARPWKVPLPCADMESPLGSGGSMLSLGVRGEIGTECFGRGLAGDRGLGLVFMFLARKRNGMEGDLLDREVGDWELRNKREREEKEVIEVKLRKRREADGEFSITLSLSPSTLPPPVLPGEDLQLCPVPGVFASAMPSAV